MKNIKLYNDVKVPVVGLGTWLIPDEEVAECVRQAVKLGYTHIDTAQAYENERGVGEGIRTCGVPREKIFITSKVKGEIKSYRECRKSINESIERLGVDYIDLMLIHCPQPWAEFRGRKRYFKENVCVWRALEEAYKEGKIRAIGVSNFLIDDLQNLIDNCEIKPMVNQILTHIGNTPLEIIDFCKSQSIAVEAYSPIAHGVALKDKEIKDMAKKYKVSIPQLCIKYTLQLGAISLPKTANPSHMKTNIDLDFNITRKDMEILKSKSGFDYQDQAFWPALGKQVR